MRLQSLKLKNFRSYNSFELNFSDTTIIVGPNTAGKTNIMEAVHMLSTGKSFRADKDFDTIRLGSEFARIEAHLSSNEERKTLALLLVKNQRGFHKRYLVNDIGKRQHDFASHLSSVLFAPTDLDIISESPGMRRRYIDSVLFQSDTSYRRSSQQYDKALRQRNRLLSMIKDGKRQYSEKEFEYWNNLLLEHSRIISGLREQYVTYINDSSKKVFDLKIGYDHSIFSLERALKYKDAEMAAGITLIGPQRDNFLIQFLDGRLVKEFASRGEQRLSILQLKLLEIEYLKQNTEVSPILLLDDIYSELDQANIEHVMNLLPQQQTVITTTHEDHIPKGMRNSAEIINLEKNPTE